MGFLGCSTSACDRQVSNRISPNDVAGDLLFRICRLWDIRVSSFENVINSTQVIVTAQSCKECPVSMACTGPNYSEQRTFLLRALETCHEVGQTARQSWLGGTSWLTNSTMLHILGL